MSTRFTLHRTVVAAVLLAAVVLPLASCSGDGDTVTNVTNVVGFSVYGDGSAGERTITGTVQLDDPQLQYTNFTVASGATLLVGSGTVIRCTGTFTNNGTIRAFNGARGSVQSGFPDIDGPYAPAEAGVSKRAASPGDYGDGLQPRYGGLGGAGLTEREARTIVRPGVKAGGGAGTFYGSSGSGDGGGSLVVRAAGSATNAGTITADGIFGVPVSGGGGGGIVIIASEGPIVNSGSISANGGDGGDSNAFGGPGGGGGGGIIHFMSTDVTMGTTSVAGGTRGVPVGPVTTTPRQGGGGGGACGGDGGDGGRVGVSDNAVAGADGDAGHVLTTNAKPGGLFLAGSLEP